MIEGVKVKMLRVIPDERGYVMEILRNDDDLFERFGQAYVTVGYPGVVKAWHYHKEQTDFFTVVSGNAKFVLYDGRQKSPTKGEIDEFFIGEKNPLLIKVPKGVYHGFKAIGNEPAMALNIPDRPYNRESPDETRVDPYDNVIPYDWRLQEG